MLSKQSSKDHQDDIDKSSLGLLNLYRPDEEPSIDVVAIHGLRGHRINTWTHSSSGKLWLRDFLPAQLPRACIWTFGYDAEIFCNPKSEPR